MAPPPDRIPEGNGLNSRVAVLEAGQRNLREDIRELKSQDVAEIKQEIKSLRREFTASRAGMTRAEKIALSGVGVTIVMAIIAAIALVQTAPGP